MIITWCSGRVLICCCCLHSQGFVLAFHILLELSLLLLQPCTTINQEVCCIC